MGILAIGGSSSLFGYDPDDHDNSFMSPNQYEDFPDATPASDEDDSDQDLKRTEPKESGSLVDYLKGGAKGATLAVASSAMWKSLSSLLGDADDQVEAADIFHLDDANAAVGRNLTRQGSERKETTFASTPTPTSTGAE